MSGAANCPETPRQKMIGMMYLVLTAMLALNVSADILNGFILVNNSLKNTLSTASVRNNALYSEFEYLNNQNPDKVGEWLSKAKAVKAESDSIYNFIEEVKMKIAKVADGADADPDSLKNTSNLDAAGQIGLVQGQGKVLQKRLTAYSETLQGMVLSQALKDQFASVFSTKSTKPGMPWDVQVFESMPAVATITILSKFQNDIRNSEAEVVQYLKAQTDAGDYRVNSINAIVIPNSKYVIRGGKYSAQIALAATDSTKKPIVKINGNLVKDGLYEFNVGSTGAFTYKGTIELPSSDGSESRFYNFTSDYIVGEPSVTISADMMNVFYAGIDNIVSISVPGVPSSSINATMAGGTLQRTATGWVAKPAKVGQECLISVSASIDGKNQPVGAKSFRVKALPPPVAFIDYKDASGNPAKYKGGVKFPKARLLAASGVKAELDDADLDVKYRVLGFDINFFDTMGNTLLETSNSSDFTDRQWAQIKKLSKGKTFYIKARAQGPDGIQRVLPPVEVIVD